MIAFAICINFVGGQIALLLKLPIYLDSIGTVLVAATLGPFYGMLPNLLSGLLMGMTVDIYSLYYAPVGIVLGFVTDLVYKKWQPKKWAILPAALLITLPSTIISSCITAFLFGGITSSGSTILMQILARTPLGLVGSCFVVQFMTDYIDRVICIAAATIQHPEYTHFCLDIRDKSSYPKLPPEEAAQWIYFMAVTNRFCTGQNILIDGLEAGNCNFIWPE